MSSPNRSGPDGGFFADLARFVRWYADAVDRAAEWYRRNEPAIRRALEAGLRFIEDFPVSIAMTSVTFARGGWSEVPLGNMNLSELTPLVERLWDEPDEVVRCELDAAILGYFGREDHAELARMVEEWGERFGERQRVFEDALFAHKRGLYTLSVPALAAQVEGVLRDLTEEYGRNRRWIERFNEAFGFRYDPRRPPPPPNLEEQMTRFMSFSAPERYEATEEMRRRFALLRINELYDHGDLSDPQFASSVKRHAILHGVFTGYGELESLRLFFLLELLHDAVSEYEERVWLVPATPSHLPILRTWRDEDPEFERRLTGFYAENDGWVREVAEPGQRSGWIAFLGGEPAGLADLDVDEDEKLGHIAFYVAPAFRRRGVGTKIVRLVAKEARHMDLADLLATVESGNEASVRCLARAGFERVGESSDRSSRFALRLRPSLPGPTIGQDAPNV